MRKLRDSELQDIASQLLAMLLTDRRENAILHYVPASEKADLIHTSRTMIRLVAGGNRCLPLDEPVLCADGQFRPLGEIKPGDRVIACDPATGRAVPSNVVRTYRSGIQPVYRVSFSDGGSFRATPEHSVPMYLGSGRTTSKGYPKEAKQRRLGDYIEPIQRRGCRNPSKRIAAMSPKSIEFDTTKMWMHPYLLGAWLGDGGNSCSPKFHNTDAVVIEKFRSLLEPMNMVLVDYGNVSFGIVNAGQQASRRPGGMSFPNRFAIALERLGLRGTGSYTKFIPKVAFSLSHEDRIQLLCGLVDTDGSLNQYSSVSKELADGFARLMRSVGGKATVSERQASCQTGAVVTAYQVYWRLEETLPLCMPRKQMAPGKRAVELHKRVCRTAEYVGHMECGDLQVEHPAHCYVAGDYVVVSNSGKTSSGLAEAVMLSTGIVPDHLRKKYPGAIEAKMRGPLNGRLICQSLVNVLEPTILPKLQWWKWNGGGPPGDDKGHFGFIPKFCLIDGEWDRSWNTRTRTLRYYYRNPENIDEIVGESTMQFFSYDQDLKDFTSAHCHYVLFDEPPPEPIYKENKMRIISANGWLMLMMTWPDDPSINVDWLHDEIWERGVPGPKKQPEYECFQLWMTDNVHLDQDVVAKHVATLTEVEKKVRVRGEQIRFSNRVHQDFTDTHRWWCFTCGEDQPARDGACLQCASSDIVEYCHILEQEWPRAWPVVHLLDPHPRKPHMMAWIGVTPYDDAYWIACEDVKGDPTEVRIASENVESALGLRVARRLIDPRMAAHPSSQTGHSDRTVLDDFDNAGIYFEPAESNIDTGVSRVNQMLKPDSATRKPRMLFHPRCEQAIYQFKRFMWDDWRQGTDKGQKQKVREKYDDYPALARYFGNADATYNGLTLGGRVVAGGYRKLGRR